MDDSVRNYWCRKGRSNHKSIKILLEFIDILRYKQEIKIDRITNRMERWNDMRDRPGKTRGFYSE